MKTHHYVLFIVLFVLIVESWGKSELPALNKIDFPLSIVAIATVVFTLSALVSIRISSGKVKGRACRILSIVCAIPAVLVGIYSLWLLVAHHEGYMSGVFATAYGSIGLVITLALALISIVLSNIKKKITKQQTSLRPTTRDGR